MIWVWDLYTEGLPWNFIVSFGLRFRPIGSKIMSSVEVFWSLIVVRDCEVWMDWILYSSEIVEVVWKISRVREMRVRGSRVLVFI